MKRLLFLGFLLLGCVAHGLEKGASRSEVIAELGEPEGSLRRDGMEILLFKTGTVTLQNGTVSATELSPDYAQKAEARALQAREFQEKKRKEQEKQKLQYPEDHVIQIGCNYSKTETWEKLPETIRPAQGEYRYDVYIPPGYYETGSRRYPGLILESPALWNSVQERARREKWIVIVLYDPAPQQPLGKTLNGNFLAAFDDATQRFRISKESLFLSGRVPAAIFATLRPVAGIILQEPDFKGFEKINFNPDFLGRNPNLRAYVLLGKKDKANVDDQAKFIRTRIPKNFIGVYEGSTAVLPKAFADKAIDWMKKEYALP